MNKEHFKRLIKPIHLNVIVSIATVLITSIGVLVCSNMIYQRFYTLSNDITREINMQAGIEISKRVDNYIENMLQVSEAVSKMLNNTSIQSKENAMKFLLQGDINTIAVFDQKGSPVFKADQRSFKTDLNVSHQPWFLAIHSGQDRFHLSDAHVQQIYDGNYPWVISFSRRISWKDPNGKLHRGFLLVDLNFGELMERCSKQSDYFGYSFILTRDGEIVYHPYQQLLYSNVPFDGVTPKDVASLSDGDSLIHHMDDKEYYVRVTTLVSNDWRVYSVSQKVGLFLHDTEVVPDIVIFVFLVVLNTVFLAVIISGIITRPLKKLMFSMKQVQEGKIGTVSDIHGFSEVTDLSHSFNEMMRRIQSLMAQLVKEQEQLRKSELKALHAQINPHFLYNTLDSVVWMAHSGETERVVEMVTALAAFFRLGLSKGSEIIPVRDELKHVENYLVIQNIRYDNQFSYQINANSDTLSLYTPNIVLQPLVENAILHGVGDMPSGGMITIKTYLQEDALIIEVADNGFGIPPEKCSDLLNTEKTSGSGVGIKNVHQRIQILYGKEYGLHYESELDKGTTVSIRLPIIDHNRDGETDEKRYL